MGSSGVIKNKQWRYLPPTWDGHTVVEYAQLIIASQASESPSSHQDKITKSRRRQIIMEQSPLKSIRAKCLDCCCGQVSEVKNCQIEQCALWKYRMGKSGRTRTMTDEQKLAAAERMKSARLAKKSLLNNDENADE